MQHSGTVVQLLLFKCNILKGSYICKRCYIASYWEAYSRSAEVWLTLSRDFTILAALLKLLDYASGIVYFIPLCSHL